MGREYVENFTATALISLKPAKSLNLFHRLKLISFSSGTYLDPEKVFRLLLVRAFV